MTAVTWAIIPGVTAAFAAAARAGVSFTVPESTQSLIITRLHGRTPVPESERLSELARHGSSVAVYLSADKAGELASQLRQAGSPENTVIVIGHKVGHPGEKIIRTTLSELEESVQADNITRQAVFLVLPKETAPQIQSRLYDASFGHGFREARRPRTWSRMAVYAMTSQGLSLARRIAAMAPADLFATSRLAEGPRPPMTGCRALSASPTRSASISPFTTPTFSWPPPASWCGASPPCFNPRRRTRPWSSATRTANTWSASCPAISAAPTTWHGASPPMSQGRPVITTATDTAGKPAIDTLAQNRDCAIANPSRLAALNSMLAEGGARHST